MQQTKLNELLTFPCLFTYKVIGLAQPSLVKQVVKVVQRYAPGNYNPKTKSSRIGNYHSISITINAINIAQVETLYEELSKLKIIRIVL